MTTRRKPRISYDRSLLLWVVTYPCCDTTSTKLHEWQVAVRIGVGHQCPEPYTPVAFPRRRNHHPATRRGVLS